MRGDGERRDGLGTSGYVDAAPECPLAVVPLRPMPRDAGHRSDLVGLYAARVADRAAELRAALADCQGGILPGHPGYALPRSTGRFAVVGTPRPVGRGTPEHAEAVRLAAGLPAHPEPLRSPRRRAAPRAGRTAADLFATGRRRLLTAGFGLVVVLAGAGGALP